MPKSIFLKLFLESSYIKLSTYIVWAFDFEKIKNK
jgi:hypothetical protein